MDWGNIGAWAGDKGPYLAIIGLQFRIIWLFLDRFFAQQKVMTDLLEVNKRAVNTLEKVEAKQEG